MSRLLAQEALDRLRTVGEGSGFTEQDPRRVASLIINSFLSVVGIVLVVYMVYAGYLWMTAGGDSDRIDTAKGIIFNCAIGLAVLLTAFAISNFVISSLVKATLK